MFRVLAYVQGESNMYRIVVTVLCRLRPPFLLKGNVPLFRYRKTPCFLWEVLLFLQNLQHESAVFPYQETGRQNVTRSGGPQIGACLILSDIFPAFYVCLWVVPF